MQSHRNWRGHDDVMQTRSFRGSGEPARVNASSNARFGLGPDPRRALGPAAMRAASTGRTHDRTRPMLHQRKKALVNQAVAVGTEISLRPPHRSRRALLTHRAPTLDGDEKPLFGPRVQDAWKWQVPVSDLLHSHPR